MMAADLDNPIWHSLQTRHRTSACRVGDAARYPADHAPFLGVAHADVKIDIALAALVESGEKLLLLGRAPRAPEGWHLETFQALAQMIRRSPVDMIDGPPMIELGEEHRADVLALTALVYPHYFRQRTMAMGRYFGIYHDDRLAAMAGERLGTNGFREISAICTHPDFSGRGYARRLTAKLVNDNLSRGCLPFLHVSYENPRAKSLYEHMGFTLRRDIGFWSLQRP